MPARIRTLSTVELQQGQLQLNRKHEEKLLVPHCIIGQADYPSLALVNHCEANSAARR